MNEKKYPLAKEALEYLETANYFDEMRYNIDGSIAIDLEDVLGEEFDHDICVNTFAEENDVWFEFDHGHSKEVRDLIDKKTKEIEKATGSIRPTTLQMFYLVQNGLPVLKKNE